MLETIIPAEIGWRVVVPVWQDNKVVDISLEPVIGWYAAVTRGEMECLSAVVVDGISDELVLRRPDPDGRYVAVGDRDLAGRKDVIDYLNDRYGNQSK